MTYRKKWKVKRTGKTAKITSANKNHSGKITRFDVAFNFHENESWFYSAKKLLFHICRAFILPRLFLRENYSC
jgi:hypothetical protein